MEIEYEKLKKNFKDIHIKYLEKLNVLREQLDKKEAEQILLREQLDKSQIPFFKSTIEKHCKENENLEKQLERSEEALYKSLSTIQTLEKDLAESHSEKIQFSRQIELLNSLNDDQTEKDLLKKQLDEKESENLSLKKQLDKISDLFDETLAANLAEQIFLREQLEEQKKKYNDLADEYV